MDNERARQQDWRASEVEAFRRLLAARAHPDSQPQPTGGEADQPADADATVRQPLGSLFEPDQPNPTAAVALPTPAGNPQLVSASATHQRRPRRWLRLALALTLALGLSSAGFVLGSSWTARTLPNPPAPPASVTQPTSVTATSIVVRQVATPACLETAKGGDQLIDLVIRNQRDQVDVLLVLFTVAARQCRKDASPTS